VTSRIDGLWRWYLAAGLLVANGFVVLRGTAARFALFDAFAAACVGGIVVGSRRDGLRARRAWLLYAAGVSLQLVGVVVIEIYLLRSGAAPQPSWADPPLLASYACFAASFGWFLRLRACDEDWSTLVDAALVGAGLGLAAWLLQDGDLRGGALAVGTGLSYTVFGALVLGAAARLLFGVGPPSFSTIALVASMGFLLAGDLVASHAQLVGSFGMEGMAPLAFDLALIAAALAAVHPSVERVPERSLPPGRRHRLVRSVVVTTAALLGPAVFVSHPRSLSAARVDVIAVAVAILWILGMTRMRLAIHNRERHTLHEAALRRSATAFVAARDETSVAEILFAAAALWAPDATAVRVYLAQHGELADVTGAAPPLSPDAVEELDRESMVETPGAALILPIRTYGRLTGALLLEAREPFRFETRAGLRMVCLQAGIALEAMRVTTEVALRELRSSFVDLFAGNLDFAVVLDGDGSIAYSSGAFGEALDVDDGTLLGSTLADFVAHGDLPPLLDDGDSSGALAFRSTTGRLRFAFCLGAVAISGFDDRPGRLLTGRWLQEG
jgi:GAF domain-containing protein